VVAVNDDASVRWLKGPSRPINPVEDRIEVLAALSCVDHIAVFSGATPIDLIEVVRPDVYVKGGDHTLESLPEVPVVRRLGGSVRLLPFMEDRSTTGIIERIQGANGEAIRS
jgi:D-beta-D-heptose 7-phosphate kinase/D-beta-D-heptose 1-phosphate adenosyltransferase